jgi:lysyl-tRNA synthetase, class II
VFTTTASFISDFWDDQLVAHGRQYHFLVLVGFIGSFGFIRLSTRLMRSPRVPWWPGSVVSEGGLHVHHHVFGIFIMMIAGVVSFALSDVGLWYDVSAFAFGIGIGLTIDEFALWLHLDDVYWSEQGRSSIDATLIAVAIMGLILLGATPYKVEGGSVGSIVAAVALFGVLGALVAICFLKQRFWHGLSGMIFSPLAVYGAARLGKPGSGWARRFYGTRRPAKQAKSERRFQPDRRTERIKKVVRDAVGGTPTDEYEAKLAAGRPPPRSE